MQAAPMAFHEITSLDIFKCNFFDFDDCFDVLSLLTPQWPQIQFLKLRVRDG
jgi:hypothetical protein